MAAVSTPLCGSSGQPRPRPRPRAHRSRHLALSALLAMPSPSRRRLQTALAAAGKPPGEAEEQVPSWARPGADEPPPWAREGGGSAQGPGAGQVPFYAYLLASAITAIAAVRFFLRFPFLAVACSEPSLLTAWLGAADRVHLRVHEPAAGVRDHQPRQRPVRAAPRLLRLHWHPDLRTCIHSIHRIRSSSFYRAWSSID
jgi:vacuolar iron transporter family protein